MMTQRQHRVILVLHYFMWLSLALVLIAAFGFEHKNATFGFMAGAMNAFLSAAVVRRWNGDPNASENAPDHVPFEDTL